MCHRQRIFATAPQPQLTIAYERHSTCRITIRKVGVYRDYGTKVELREALQRGERVALSPPADITEGQQVKVAAHPADAKAEAKK